LEKIIAEKETATKSKDSVKVLTFRAEILKRLHQIIDEFQKSDKKVGVLELPNLSNTSFILEFTQQFLECVFLYAKTTPDCNSALFLKKLIPGGLKTILLGDLGEYSSNKGLVNKMGQIALQGRKFGVGLIVIAQRTANVSKTVLTQCNTVICFQAFDDTSFNFLGNYVGQELVRSLPNLKKYHAIVAGKAINSNIPMIVDLTRQEANKT